jgi:hypothetical protein
MYLYPYNYSSLIENLTFLADIPDQELKFLEPCYSEEREYYINRVVIGKKLLRNDSWRLFFEGFCSELGRARIFEMVLHSYELEVNGAKISPVRWVHELLGCTAEMAELEYWAKSGRCLWRGKSAPISYYERKVDYEVPGDYFYTIHYVEVMVTVHEIILAKNQQIYLKCVSTTSGDVIFCKQPSEIVYLPTSSPMEFNAWTRKYLKLNLKVLTGYELIKDIGRATLFSDCDTFLHILDQLSVTLKKDKLIVVGMEFSPDEEPQEIFIRYCLSCGRGFNLADDDVDQQIERLVAKFDLSPPPLNTSDFSASNSSVSSFNFRELYVGYLSEYFENLGYALKFFNDGRDDFHLLLAEVSSDGLAQHGDLIVPAIRVFCP